MNAIQLATKEPRVDLTLLKRATTQTEELANFTELVNTLTNLQKLLQKLYSHDETLSRNFELEKKQLQAHLSFLTEQVEKLLEKLNMPGDLTEAIADSFSPPIYSSKKRKRRIVPLLDGLEYSLLLEYTEKNLIFDRDNELLFVFFDDLYKHYLHFLYEKLGIKNQSFELFERELIIEKTKKAGVISKYRFGTAVEYIAKQKYNCALVRKKAQKLRLIGVSLNPHTKK